MKEFKEYKAEKDATKIDESSNQRAIAVEKHRRLHDNVKGEVSEEIKAGGEPSMVVEAVRAAVDDVMKNLGLEEKVIMPSFKEYHESRSTNAIPYLNESENEEVDRWVNICEKEYNGNMLDEGFLGKLIGGAAGFIVGPAIGRIVARALGIDKGILYDMFTSRLVSTALGAAIADAYSKKD